MQRLMNKRVLLGVTGKDEYLARAQSWVGTANAHYWDDAAKGYFLGADDTEDVIRNRFKVYRDETAPLLDYYSDNLATVDAVGELDEVFARALKALGR